jgi:hypothetical protein
VVVDGDRERFLGALLSDHVLIEDVVDFLRLRNVPQPQVLVDVLVELFLDDLVAELDTLVADVDARSGDQFPDLLLRLAAETTLQLTLLIAESEHSLSAPLVYVGTVPWPARNFFGENLVDEAVLFGILGGHVVVAVDVLEDLLDGLLRRGLVDARQHAPRGDQVAGGDLHVGGLAADLLDPGLVDQDLGVGQGDALARGAAGQQDRAHRGGHAGADRRDVGLDQLHGVVDRQSGRHAAARAVDVHVDIFIGVFALQEQQLGDHEVGQVVVDRAADEDDPLLEQPRIDVEGPLAARALFDDHGNEVTHPTSLLRFRGAAGSAVYWLRLCGWGVGFFFAPGRLGGWLSFDDVRVV